jgi:hypothetical protein
LKVLVSDQPWEEGWQGSSPSQLLDGLRRGLEGARFGEARCEVEVLEAEAP